MEKVKGLRTYKNMKGAIFDIEEADVKQVEMAIKSFKIVNPGFAISKCETLPELTHSDQSAYGQRTFRSNVDIRQRKDIFVGNLPYDCNEDNVYKFLSESNGIPQDGIEIRMVRDKESGTHKGYCFLSVYDDDKFNKIMNMKNRNLSGKTLRIDDANNKRR